ncbi:MAG TPA: RodZ domain-containing protein [Bryobacteraceae bacterium]|jgi:cytoskeleton protein RodZ|nr:RodZ domain-containing protein [Bryobacteraceae bacterium]
MNSVGAVLKTERERQGRDLAEIAGELCITQRYLRAIEQDDLKSLPGTFFYKSFVKQYAASLGVDESVLQSGIESLTAVLEPLPLPGADPKYGKRAEPPPLRDLDPIVRDGNRRYFPDSRMGLSIAALVAMLLATSGFYAWYNKAAQSAPPISADERTARAANPAPASARPMVEEPVKTEAAAPASLNVTSTTGADGVNHVVLNLSATEKTWLSITSEGKQIFSGVLEPSQTKTLTGLDVAKMKVGNAGGLEVMWNGKPIGPIGPRGQVRIVLFTPDNFQILTPNQAL